MHLGIRHSFFQAQPRREPQNISAKKNFSVSKKSQHHYNSIKAQHFPTSIISLLKKWFLLWLPKENAQGSVPSGVSGHGTTAAKPATLVCQPASRRLSAILQSLCSCTDGLCSFIHKGFANFDPARHLRRALALVARRASGRWARWEWWVGGIP